MEAAARRTRLKGLVEQYFARGHRYSIIAFYLRKNYQITTTVRTIKRVLNQLGLKRNGNSLPSTSLDFQAAVATVQMLSGNRAGYRRTWHLLNYSHRIRVTQDRVRRYLRQLDPGAVDNRVRRLLIRRCYNSPGPNHVWHFDGYDKLKPFGFAIHGCSDGYSRKIIWLQCSITNNNPAVILYHYLDTVRKIGGCPTLLRSDCGTETGLAAAAQCTLRNNPRSHVYGPSYRNQRIESWWSKLRSGWTQIWIDLFDDLWSVLEPMSQVILSIELWQSSAL